MFGDGIYVWRRWITQVSVQVSGKHKSKRRIEVAE